MPTRLREIRCLSLGVNGPLPTLPSVTRLASLRDKGSDAPPAYCPIISILLNIKRGNGITTVRPLRVIKLVILRNTGMSGCLA